MEKSLLTHVLASQQVEFEQTLKYSIRRSALGSLQIPKGSRRALVITGVRRSGKSTLALQLAAGMPYVGINFDDERLGGFVGGDFDLFLQAAHEIEPKLKVLLLDEIQNIQGWELFVNRILRKNYGVIITGSNASLLSQELASHLTGRTESYELFPFSLNEFFAFKKLACSDKNWTLPEKRAQFVIGFKQYLQEGGFPEMVVHGYSAAYMRELFNQLITRDIVSRYQLRQSKVIKELGLLLISQSGNLISYQKLSKALELSSVNTVKRFVEYLEQSYLVFQVPHYDEKVKEIIKKPRKIYGIDPGMHQALTLKSTDDMGSRLENFVFLELRRRGKEIYSWRDEHSEIDFVIREGLKTQELIQVSYSIQSTETRAREIKAFEIALAKLRCKKLTLLTFDEGGTLSLSGGIPVNVSPAWKWALEN